MILDRIRVSIGSAVKLGLKNIAIDVKPTNCHLLTYSPKGCLGNCGFCPQSKFTFKKLDEIEDTQEFLSRVMWPDFSFDRVLRIFQTSFPQFSLNENGFQRICLQSLNYEGFEDDVLEIVKALKRNTTIPISLAIPPVSDKYLIAYKREHVDRVCFAVDACREDLFESVKGQKGDGPYSWDDHIDHLKKATIIYGRGRVTTHLIIGLGETDMDALSFISQMKKMGILTGLFAFYPIKNTRLESEKRPDIIKFRKMQLGKYLIDTGKRTISDFKFNDDSLTSFDIETKDLRDIVDLSAPFQTSGCPGCNRPFYTSSPREEQYNYPRELRDEEKEKVFSELTIYCRKDE